MKSRTFSHLFFKLLAATLITATITGSCKKKEPTIPSVVMDPLSSVTTTSASGGGLIIDDGGASIVSRGLCWNTNSGPTITDGNAPAGSGMGSFSATLTGLTATTRYYVRAYATNEAGTGYSSELILQTMAGTVTDVDGNVYQTVGIGPMEWMAENLKVTHYRNGAGIPKITDYNQWAGSKVGAYTWYANDKEMYGKYYGALYNWFAVNDSAGLCPEGWHIPSAAEWDTTFYALGGDAVAGGKLKSTLTNLYQQPYWFLPNYYGTNESGFNALPGGFRSFIEGAFSGLSASGIWWSSTPDSIDIKGTFLTTNSGAAFRELINRNTGASVRCVKD